MSLNLIMGARNGAKNERQEHDYYATHPQAVRDFLEALDRDGVELNKYIWECACGEGYMAEVFKDNGYNVYATDLINRGYGISDVDFLTTYEYPNGYDIFTNPPFKLAEEFAYRGNKILQKGHKFGLFVKIQFLESKSRKKLFEKYPPKYIYVYSERQQCALNGDFEKYKKGGKTQAYIWVIWEKGWKGETITRWI
jgi:hypothetical protein